MAPPKPIMTIPAAMPRLSAIAAAKPRDTMATENI
jgi:hypothetical protein|tara:strand:- start:1428 stop:1532 length:105 start_codon:yes stop_codon:yes gene_type:complete